MRQRQREEGRGSKENVMLPSQPSSLQVLEAWQLATLLIEEKRQEEEAMIAPMMLLSGIQTTLGEQPSGCIYVETKVWGKKF